MNASIPWELSSRKRARTFYDLHSPADHAVATVVVGVALLVAGLTAWLRRPANRVGPLLAVAGLALLARQLRYRVVPGGGGRAAGRRVPLPAARGQPGLRHVVRLPVSAASAPFVVTAKRSSIVPARGAVSTVIPSFASLTQLRGERRYGV